MQFRALVAAALAVGAVYAKNGPLHVVYPRPCSHVCGPVVTQSQGNCIDAGLKCICYQPHMTHLIPLCEACAFNQKDSKNGVDFYPSVKMLLEACKLPPTSITLGAAAPTPLPILGAGAAAALAALAAL